MDSAVAILMGLGLAAASGFRVFLPLLALALTTRLGIVVPAEEFAWIGSWPALLALGTAATLEIGGYYLPWVDHVLDTIATPAAFVAGTLLAASQMGALDPLVQWGAGAVAGGGLAGAIQLGTVTTRVASTATTGGAANPVVATVENVVSATVSLVALLVPIALGLVMLALAAFLLYRWTRRPRAGRPPAGRSGRPGPHAAAQV